MGERRRAGCGAAADVGGTLGVTIDALFGLEGGEKPDMEDAVRRWIAATPKEQRLDKLCHLVWSAIKGTLSYRGLELLHSRAARYYAAGTLAALLGISDGEAEELLEELTSLRLLARIELELNDGPVHAYTLRESGVFIPFLYLARCLTDHAVLVVNYKDRKPPALRGEKWKEA